MNGREYTMHDIRRYCLWGTLMAGGAGAECYFGYDFPQNDLRCEDFRSRDQSWDFCRIALGLFRDLQIPFWEMQNADRLVGNEPHDNSRYCLAKSGSEYLVYLPEGGTCALDLTAAEGEFRVLWLNPRRRQPPQLGTTHRLTGGSRQPLGDAPEDRQQDSLVIVRRE